MPAHEYMRKYFIEIFQPRAKPGKVEYLNGSDLKLKRGIRTEEDFTSVEGAYRAVLSYYRRKKSEYSLLVVLEEGTPVFGFELTIYDPKATPCIADLLPEEYEGDLKGKTLVMMHNHPMLFKRGLPFEDYERQIVPSAPDMRAYENDIRWAGRIGVNSVYIYVVGGRHCYRVYPTYELYVSDKALAEYLVSKGFKVLGVSRVTPSAAGAPEIMSRSLLRGIDTSIGSTYYLNTSTPKDLKRALKDGTPERVSEESAVAWQNPMYWLTYRIASEQSMYDDPFIIIKVDPKADEEKAKDYYRGFSGHMKRASKMADSDNEFYISERFSGVVVIAPGELYHFSKSGDMSRYVLE